jgi:hypothetical protein
MGYDTLNENEAFDLGFIIYFFILLIVFCAPLVLMLIS